MKATPLSKKKEKSLSLLNVLSSIVLLLQSTVKTDTSRAVGVGIGIR